MDSDGADVLDLGLGDNSDEFDKNRPFLIGEDNKIGSDKILGADKIKTGREGLLARFNTAVMADCSASRCEALRHTLRAVKERKCTFLHTPKGQMRQKVMLSILLHEQLNPASSNPQVIAHQ